ncbi:Rpn family recombination-promoting nuclease/putative transposase [bacterium]|nr:Rpn family recombination-promoting nuclease/putative transposase [bacterium]
MEEEITLLPVREFPDRGTKWLLETPENVECLLRIISVSLADCIDFSRLRDLKTTFIPDNLRKQESDLVFLAPFVEQKQGSEQEVMIYILIEHQSKPSWEMGFRMLFYMTQIWDRQRRAWVAEDVPETQWRFRPILPVLFYTGKANWKAPLSVTALMDLPEELEAFVPQHRTLFLNLKNAEPEKLVAEGHPFGWVLRVIQKEYAKKEGFVEALRLAVSHLDKLSEEEKNQWEKLMYYLVLLILHRRDEEEQPEFISLVNETVKDYNRREEVAKMGRTAAQALMEEGEIRGVLRARREDLLKFIRGKFQSVPTFVEQKILTIRDVNKLSVLIDNVISANSIDEISIE